MMFFGADHYIQVLGFKDPFHSILEGALFLHPFEKKLPDYFTTRENKHRIRVSWKQK